ncbi:twin-arginine translocase TatA/TatE family subunit [Pseudoclavibacter sp. CFCC 13796]|uniref:Sec-independent protein translocase subunit TatA n=1 Tax=Pseudoclavibacter sp. CFCC 13796 TaxID=2615179 RepID=UPI0013016EBB|nr:Sec-independent protein translocase subunit TatA [Pseudoclavibacter sp. CFCC 13796]KAB1661093.1 twin-arginine translocase TatA/TatE family subunit [Pseudoclavibacter sp. CFCC 13796]
MKPWQIIIIVLVILLLFGAPKLPGLAKSLGQSMRIFRKEVKGFEADKAADSASAASSAAQPQAQAPQSAPAQPPARPAEGDAPKSA